MASLDTTSPPPDGDRNRGTMLLAVTWVEFSLAALLLLGRVVTRTRIISFLGWDDAVMCLAMVLATVNSSLITISTQHGMGRHKFYLSEDQSIDANKFNFLSQGFHVMSTNFGKVSIALFLLRVMGKSLSQRVVIYSGIFLVTAINAISTYSIYGQCKPAEALWDYRVEGRCWEPSVHQNYAFFQGSFSAFSDGVLAIYPIFIIWNLQMAKRMKLGLGLVMALGIFAMVAAIVKTVYLADLTARSDYTFDTIMLTIWVSTEQYIIIIAGCIPALGPLIKVAMGKPPTSKRTHSSGYTPSNKTSNRRVSGMYVSTQTPLAPLRYTPTGDQSHLKFQGTPGFKSWTRARRGNETDVDIEQIAESSSDDEARGNSGGIIKTTEFHLKSHNVGEGGSSADSPSWKSLNSRKD